MSILKLPMLAILALQAPTTQSPAPSPTPTPIPDTNKREFTVSVGCGARMDTRAVGLEQNEEMQFVFTSQCMDPTEVLIEPKDANRNPLVCRPTAGTPAMGTKFDVRRGMPATLICRNDTAVKGVYTYTTKSCRLSSGMDCTPTFVPLAHELEIHVPGR